MDWSNQDSPEVKLLHMKANILNFAQYAKLPATGTEPGGNTILFATPPHIIQLFQALALWKFLFVLKAKQEYVSWSLALQALHDIYFQENALVLEYSQGDLYSQELLNKSKTLYLNLPLWMQRYDISPNTTEAIGFKETGSIIRAFPSTKTAGVGLTGTRVLHDEADFHEKFKENYSHTKATIQHVPNGKMACVSTSNHEEPDSFFKEQYKLARDGLLSEAKALFFGYFNRPERTEETYRIERQDAINSGTLPEFEKNYPLTEDEALSPISAKSVFDEGSLKILWDNAEDAPEVRQGFIHIYRKFQPGWIYAAGVDVGEGVGLDYSVLTILGRYGGSKEVVALIYSNEIDTALFALEVSLLCEEYRNPLLGVENNAIGVAVINKLLELDYKNLYYSDSGKQKAGWTTGDKNKQLGIAELVPEINSGTIVTRFRPQVKELMEYQFDKGKATPKGKTHGDTVISLILAHQMMKKVRTGGDIKVVYT